MIIKEINLGHFGKFHDSHVMLKPGINILYGPNEAGKSTLHAFIRGMLFGIDKPRGRASKDDMYTKYEPWDTPGAYQGSMVIEIDGEDYRITRSFYKKEKRLSVVSVRTGREVATEESELQQLLKGLTESVYRNTVSIEQLKAKTDLELAQELKNYITNLSMSKSTEVDVNRALTYLVDKKKQIEKSIPNDQIKMLEETIAKEEEAISQCEKLNDELAQLTEQLEEIKAKRLKYSDPACKEKLAKLTMLPAVKEKYRIYKDMVTQKLQLEDRMSSLIERTKRAVGELDNSSVIQAHLEELQELRQKKQQYEDEIRAKRTEWENNSTQRKVNGKSMGIMNALLGIAVILIPIGNPIIRCSIGVFLMFFGILEYVYRATKDEHNLKLIEDIEKQFEKKVFQLHSKRHDILLQHRVTNENQLLIKFNDVTKNELEREQLLERKAEYLISIKELKEKAEKLEIEIINVMKYFIEDAEVTDSCMEELKLVAEEYKEEVTSGEEEYQTRYAELKSQIERIRWTLEANHNQDAQLLHDREEYKHLLEQRESMLHEIEAITLSIQTLKDLSSTIHDSFGSRLNEVVSEMIAKISSNEYQEVTVDENLNIKVLQKTRYVSIDSLSSGTMDQMYLALRLAVAQLLFPNEKLPIILDDAFALYDDKRTSEALHMLTSQCKRQIILLTCHKREEEIINSEGIEANVIHLEKNAVSESVIYE
ncbi:MAG: AAA family ATPase [Clostridiales bacterium]|nr:AAA family ATPase [Clostridiales bacterium]